MNSERDGRWWEQSQSKVVSQFQSPSGGRVSILNRFYVQHETFLPPSPSLSLAHSRSCASTTAKKLYIVKINSFVSDKQSHLLLFLNFEHSRWDNNVTYNRKSYLGFKTFAFLWYKNFNHPDNYFIILQYNGQNMILGLKCIIKAKIIFLIFFFDFLVA